MMVRTVSNSEDIMDSRDVIARIEELNELVSAGDIDHEDAEELRTLEAFAADASDYSEDWEYGATMIRDSYFKEYAQEFADDIGAIDRNATWPTSCIDWDQAARELQMDYTSVEFDGVTYWVR